MNTTLIDRFNMGTEIPSTALRTVRILLAMMFLCILLGGAAHGAEQPDKALQLIPQPKTIERVAGQCPLGPTLQIEIKDPALKNEAAVLTEDLAPRLNHLNASARLKITLALAPGIPGVPAGKAQAYRLETGPDGIQITGVDAEGVFCGTRTLLQILDNQHAPSQIPALAITDWPDIRYRASQHDTRSQIMQMGTLKRFIQGLADLKYNQFYLYVENAFQYSKHPEIAPDYSFSPADIKELVAFGKRYHVEIIPIQQSLGHQPELLRLPKYSHLSEIKEPLPGLNFPWTLSPAYPETYQLLGDMYADWLALCPSKFFHGGCDEAADLGLGASKELAEKIGVGGVFIEHVKRLQKLLPEGRRLGIWGDMLLEHKKEVEGKIPKDVIIYDWHYTPKAEGYPSVEWFRKQGLDVFICPTTVCCDWEFIDTESITRTIEFFTATGKKHGAIGFLNTNWEFPYQGFIDKGWHGFAYGADAAWSSDAARRQTQAFDARFARVFFRSDAADLGKIFRLLGEPDTILRREWPDADWMSSSKFFHENPQTQDYAMEMDRIFLGQRGFHMFSRAQLERTANQVLAVADQADRLLAAQSGKVEANRDVLPVLDYASKKWHYFAHRLLYVQSARDAYEQALARPSDRIMVNTTIQDARSLLVELAAELDILDGTMRDLWAARLKDAGLVHSSNMYLKNRDLYLKMVKSLDAAAAQFAAKGTLPAASEVGLAQVIPEKAVPAK